MKIERQCPICNVTYKANQGKLRQGKNTTCSRDCSYKLRAAKLKKQVLLKCATCGKEFTRAPSKMKGKYGTSFCSPGCHYQGRSENHTKRQVTKPYKIPAQVRHAQAERMRAVSRRRKKEGRYAHTEETKKKLSATTSKAIAEGRFPCVSTLETKVERVLQQFGIPYKAQTRFTDGVNHCVVDFYLFEHNIALEVNGTFWHSDPRYYPGGPVHLSQKKVGQSFQRKTRILSELGIRLEVVWEHDITANLEDSVKKALDNIL